jgi:nicotinate-nucleotide pyrophosphorylase (carboxylating)
MHRSDHRVFARNSFAKGMQTMMNYDQQIDKIIRLALLEDIQTGDITTNAIYTGKEMASAKFIAKQDGIVAGIGIAIRVARMVDEKLVISWGETVTHPDGTRFSKGEVIAQIHGPANSLLTAERTMLNFVQRMSGIATRVREFTNKISHTKAVILDTRKTLPGHRITDKMAVVIGGGQNHRFGLYDRYLIKENHIAVAGGIANAIIACQKHRDQNSPSKEIEIEVTNLDQLQEVLQFSDVTYVMLDNMNIETMRQAVQRNNKQAAPKKLEASGNVGLHNVASIAETGVDFISIGSITHSVNALDISLLFD